MPTTGVPFRSTESGLLFWNIVTFAVEVVPRHLIESVEPEDPMVQLLSASKGQERLDSTRAMYQAAFCEAFDLKLLGKALSVRSLVTLD